jgi:hypothetical protein
MRLEAIGMWAIPGPPSGFLEEIRSWREELLELFIVRLSEGDTNEDAQ